MLVELNHSLQRLRRGADVHGVLGDITSEEILHAAHIESARLLLLTMPDPNTIHLSLSAPAT